MVNAKMTFCILMSVHHLYKSWEPWTHEIPEKSQLVDATGGSEKSTDVLAGSCSYEKLPLYTLLSSERSCTFKRKYKYLNIWHGVQQFLFIANHHNWLSYLRSFVSAILVRLIRGLTLRLAGSCADWQAIRINWHCARLSALLPMMKRWRLLTMYEVWICNFS